MLTSDLLGVWTQQASLIFLVTYMLNQQTHKNFKVLTDRISSLDLFRVSFQTKGREK